MSRRLLAALLCCALVALPSGASARQGRQRAPEWVRPALRYLVDGGHLERSSFKVNDSMSRGDFSALMESVFRGGYSRKGGRVTAGEVSAALVKVLDARPVARELTNAKSPDGWDPEVTRRFGSEVVAREMGLRHDRPTGEEAKEASAPEPMREGDIVYAVWKAAVDPDTWAVDALETFGLSNYDEDRRAVVRFALSLVGTPYVWGGEWLEVTPNGYPYGEQKHGGFDCSGFSWYVLRASAPGWDPVGRPYKGWNLPQRSSYDMAGAIKKRNRLKYRELEPGDLAFFAPSGRDAVAKSVYHAGIYLGKGWMVHSSGSRAGISLGEIGPGSWWHSQFAWGRRVIK